MTALKLRAVDAEDLAVIAAFLQDSVIPVEEMAYLADERRFVLVANRFRWEDALRERYGEGTPVYERVHAGVTFDTVRAVKRLGIDRRRRDQMLSVLTIDVPDDGVVVLTFAGGAALRLEVDRVLCHLEDFGEPWPTQWRPAHPLEVEG